LNFKEIFFNKIFSLRNLFFIGNILALSLFVIVLVLDYCREWKPYQKNYKKMEIEKLQARMEAGNEDIRKALENELDRVGGRPIEIKQIMATDLNRVDRCISCHVGLDSLANPELTNDFKEHPYAAPENQVHQAHAFEKFACTVCHEGQGLATTFIGAAHMPINDSQKQIWQEKYDWEIIHHWQDPMNAGQLIYSSCSKCHESHPNVEGMDIVKKGESLVFENGCVGCHQIRGKGGTIAPDLAMETSVKPIARIDFGFAVTAGLISKNERTLENWIRLHFSTAPSVLTPGDPEGHLSPAPTDPQPVAPSAMPYFGFSDEETESLVAYVMSLKSEKLPYTYRVQAPPQKEPYFATATKRGRYVYQKHGCAGCHGKNADQGIEVFNKLGGRVPNLVKILATYTKKELIDRIKKGVNPEAKADESGPTPPIFMPSFKDKIKGREMQDLVVYLLSIAEEDEEW